jgi:thiamine biosynthesis lipoprotein
MPRALLIFTILFLFTACSDNSSKVAIKFQGSTMGTQYHIVLITTNNQHTIEDKLNKSIDDLLLELNQQMSTYIATSEISLFNQYKQKNWFPVSYGFAQVVLTAQGVSRQSNGAFDITVAPLIDLWGFGAKTQLTVPTEQQINKALKNTGYQQIEVRVSPPALRKLNPNLRIDLSAIAKGFAVDKISEHLSKNKYSNYLVEIGGEIRNQGLNQKGKPWKIGIEVPEKNTSKTNQTLLTSNVALATSGDYRNYFMKNGIRFSHTINPSTGKPITHKLASVTVLHKSTMMADAYATALMVLGENKGKDFAKTQNIKVNMIIRDNDSGFSTWKNFDETKLVH